MQPNLLSEIQVVPGISNLEAVLFQLNQLHNKGQTNYRKIYQFHKANIEGLHRELHQFQSSNPYASSVEDNWSVFKQELLELLDKYAPSKTPNSGKHLPWLNKFIKHKMKKRKKLYDRARRTQAIGDWENYKKIKNYVNLSIKAAYNKYCNHLFDNSLLVIASDFGLLLRCYRRILRVYHL